MNLSQQLYQSLLDDIDELTLSHDFQWHWWKRAKELKILDKQKYRKLIREKDRILWERDIIPRWESSLARGLTIRLPCCSDEEFDMIAELHEKLLKS